MAKHKKKIKGSTIIIVFMYLTWVGYLALQIWCYKNLQIFLPNEVTIATAALFIAETVSLARLKMAKEGTDVGDKKTNPWLQRLGIGDCDFEDEVQKARHCDDNPLYQVNSKNI